MQPRGREWQDGFYALGVVLGEDGESIERHLRSRAGEHDDEATVVRDTKEARAKRVATGLAAITRELDAQGRAPWPE